MSYNAKRRLLAVLDAVVLIGVITTVVLLFLVLGKLNSQVVSIHNDQQASTARIERDLECLQKFFGLPGRQNLKIADLPSCRIERIASGARAGAGAGVSPTPASSPSAGRPPATGSSAVADVVGTPTPAPAATSPEPVRLLGIPVCLPLTQICIER